MALDTRMLLFVFFQTGAVVASMMDSQLDRGTFAAESFSHSKASAAASIQSFKNSVAAQKDSEPTFTESQRRKILKIKHEELKKKYGTPEAAPQEPGPLPFSPGWKQPASHYMPERNLDIAPVYLRKKNKGGSSHNHANLRHAPIGNFARIYADHMYKVRTAGADDLNHQKMETRIHQNHQTRKEITKQQKKLGLLRKKGRPIVQDDKQKRKMRDSHASKGSDMEDRMMRRLAFNQAVH